MQVLMTMKSKSKQDYFVLLYFRMWCKKTGEHSGQVSKLFNPTKNLYRYSKEPGFDLTSYPNKSFLLVLTRSYNIRQEEWEKALIIQ